MKQWSTQARLNSCARHSRDRSAHDQLHQRHDFAAQRRDDHPSQRLHERRSARCFIHPMTWRSLSVDAADVPRQRLDVRLDRHGRGRDAYLSAQGRAARGLRDDAAEKVTMLCAAPTVLIGIANAPEDCAASAPRRARPHRRRAAGRRYDRANRGRTRMGDHARLRTDRDIAVHHHLRAAPRTRSRCRRERAVIKARQGVELITSGELRVVDDEGREVPHDGETMGEIVVRGNVVMEGYYNDPEATAEAMRGGWFHTGDAAVVHPDGYAEIRDRMKDVIISGGENISSVEVEGVLLRHPGRAGGGDRRLAAREMGRGAARFCCAPRRRDRH